MSSNPFVSSAILVTGCFCGMADGGPPGSEASGAAVHPAGTEFAIQGEYVGQVGQQKTKWGAHVVADGKGRFRAIGYIGGLPGDGWTGQPGQYVTGKIADGVATFLGEGIRVVADGATLRIQTDDSTQIGHLKKVNRKSETMGRVPPGEAIVLFAGESLDHWVGGKIVERHLAAANCSTKRKFGDHELHLEFRIPFMPASMRPDRGNSGVYIQSRYELQILDSFGLPAKRTGCGAIYKVRKPKINMCFPPLAWQTYDVEFTSAKWEGSKKVSNARMTVRHNGVTIHQDVEIPARTPGRLKEAPGPQPLFLQNHGSPVVFRNIWVVEK